MCMPDKARGFEKNYLINLSATYYFMKFLKFLLYSAMCVGVIIPRI